MPIGTVRKFNTEKGYGFVAPDHDRAETVFVHFRQVRDEQYLRPGQRVSYELERYGRRKSKRFPLSFMMERSRFRKALPRKPAEEKLPLIKAHFNKNLLRFVEQARPVTPSIRKPLLNRYRSQQGLKIKNSNSYAGY